jgi:hypothetical protein
MNVRLTLTCCILVRAAHSATLDDLKALDLVEDVMKPVLEAEAQAADPVVRLCRYGAKCRHQQTTCSLEHVPVEKLPCPYYALGGCKDRKCKYLAPHSAEGL